jgi:glycosyltransferase involved in cell wall biosynthesis
VASRRRIDAVRDALAPLAPTGVLIVPAFDEAVLLPRFLASVARLDAPPGAALLLCANNCRDATVPIAREWQGRLPLAGPVVVESVLRPPNVGRVRVEAARGALEAGCRWLAFTDADGELPDADFLREAERLCDAEPEGCFAGPSDEFADARRALHAVPASGVAPGSPADRLLAFGSEFRCRALPKALAWLRYTDGSNSLVTAKAYAECGGFGERRVGGDSVLGDRYVARFGCPLGFFDRPVHTSSRKPLAMGRPGGFVFYPARAPALPTVRSAADARALGSVSAGRAFETICEDLRGLLLFSLRKRRAWLRKEGIRASDVARDVARACTEFRRTHDAPVALDADGAALVVRHVETQRVQRLALDRRAEQRFWQTGE